MSLLSCCRWRQTRQAGITLVLFKPGETHTEFQILNVFLEIQKYWNLPFRPALPILHDCEQFEENILNTITFRRTKGQLKGKEISIPIDNLLQREFIGRRHIAIVLRGSAVRGFDCLTFVVFT